MDESRNRAQDHQQDTQRCAPRPFAGHRDSISELIGNIVENAIEDALSRSGISYRKTKRAERLDGFDQAPDFVVPNEFNPHVVIKAKLTEDDGTARDTGFETAAITGGECIEQATGKVRSGLVEREFLANVVAAPIRWNPGAVE